MSGFISSVLSAIWNVISSTNVMQSISSTVSSIWDNIRSAVSDKISGIKSTIQNGFGAAVGYIKGLASDAWNWGRDIIQGIIDGIQSAISWLADCVTNVADTIRDFLHFSVPDKGPLTDYESWMPDFMKGLADGIDKSKKYVEKAVGGGESHAADYGFRPELQLAWNLRSDAARQFRWDGE